MAVMQVDVVSAERALFSGEASEVYARTPDGEIGILPGHQPVLLALEVAPLRVKTEGGDELVLAVHSGFLEFRDNHLTVLADVAERAEDIDVGRAEGARSRAEERLAGEDDAAARAALARANVRVSVAR
jgi:F-type H+-transporting ATPase subunit epsilon